MFYVYIIYSAAIDQYYVGQSANIEDRFFRHNNLKNKSTKKANDWVLKYNEVFQNRSEAIKRETAIKKKKSRKYIEWIIGAAGEASTPLGRPP